jgi:septum formation protein
MWKHVGINPSDAQNERMMTRNEKQSLILASASARRKDLLEQAGIKFDVIAPTFPEPAHKTDRSPEQWAQSLAYFKARAVADKHPDRTVIGADTICVLGDEVLGKARDADHARDILRKLSGTKHAVITGVAICGPDGKRLIASQTTGVQMAAMSDADIDAYIKSGEWIDKAGAYAIQDTADRYVERLEGRFDNVVGLPVDLVLRMLTRMEYLPCTCDDRVQLAGSGQ